METDMTFYCDTIGTALIDVDALPWVPFLPYSDQVHIKLIKIDPVRGEWTSLLRTPGGMELPKHHHSGTVHVYTLQGRWRYKEHDWVAGPGPFVFETAASAHTPLALEDEVITLNIVMGDWNLVDDNNQVLAVENWRTMTTRYVNHCSISGITPVDLTSFGGN
jgi:hypothetical protein